MLTLPFSFSPNDCSPILSLCLHLFLLLSQTFKNQQLPQQTTVISLISTVPPPFPLLAQPSIQIQSSKGDSGFSIWAFRILLVLGFSWFWSSFGFGGERVHLIHFLSPYHPLILSRLLCSKTQICLQTKPLSDRLPYSSNSSYSDSGQREVVEAARFWLHAALLRLRYVQEEAQRA